MDAACRRAASGTSRGCCSELCTSSRSCARACRVPSASAFPCSSSLLLLAASCSCSPITRCTSAMMACLDAWRDFSKASSIFAGASSTLSLDFTSSLNGCRASCSKPATSFRNSAATSAASRLAAACTSSPDALPSSTLRSGANASSVLAVATASRLEAATVNSARKGRMASSEAASANFRALSSDTLAPSSSRKGSRASRTRAPTSCCAWGGCCSSEASRVRSSSESGEMASRTRASIARSRSAVPEATSPGALCSPAAAHCSRTSSRTARSRSAAGLDSEDVLKPRRPAL
mmetsp:Transcript_90192/g.269086  ORF Transcript_90192/g.269086 Transcript_90192/m.269086 type:complete len:292 (-) Transcript_90192:224-1099(-)